MTKQHFEAVAESIKFRVTNAINQTEKDAFELLASDLAARFAIFNPRFDTQRFLRGCGLADAEREV